MEWYIVLFLTYFLTVSCDDSGVAVLEGTDRDLDVAISSSDYVLAFIYVGDCTDEPCKKDSNKVDIIASHTYIRDLKVLKIRDSEEALKYRLKKLPALIFYRRAVPLLYSPTLIEADAVVVWLEQNKQSNVQELTDDNFEHLTQATTGATTGDWMIMFYDSECNTHVPVWEGVGVRLKHVMNTATVDTSIHNEVSERLKIEACPTVLLLRQGWMYKFSAEMTENSLVDFAKKGYLNVKPSTIPKVPSAFDNLMPKIVKFFKTISSFVASLYFLLALFLVGLVITVARLRGKTKTEKTS